MGVPAALSLSLLSALLSAQGRIAGGGRLKSMEQQLYREGAGTPPPYGSPCWHLINMLRALAGSVMLSGKKILFLYLVALLSLDHLRDRPFACCFMW